MKVFSEKINYGLLALFELAKNRHKGFIQIKEIAASQNIPQNYLEQLLIMLKKGDLVESMRGAQGGYRLKKPANEIKIIDLIEVLEGSLTIIDYSKMSEPFQSFWKNIEEKLKELLSYTLEKLVLMEDQINKRLFFQI
ncbi:MAG: RrF2 family transcriptional regulator [Promethearchaeota archaeon]